MYSFLKFSISGGGAVQFDPLRGRFILRGVVSGSARQECGTLYYPNIYVRVAATDVLMWILEEMTFIHPNSAAGSS